MTRTTTSSANWGTSAALGIAFAALASLWNGRPALWLDEVATLSATQRSWSELIAMLRTVDLVHALYYALMQAWVALVPDGAFWLRLPSALCVGVTVLALHRVARRFVDERMALTIAVVGGCLPRVLWAGSEAREQAMAMGVAALATLALLHARNSGRRLAWLGYGTLLVTAAFLSMFAVFLAPAHVAWAWLLRRHHPWRGSALVAALAMLPVAPWVLASRAQSAQVSWIGARTPADVAQQLLIKHFFYGDDKPSGFEHGVIVLGLIVALALAQAVLLVRLWLGRRELGTAQRELTLLALCIVAIPLVLLLLANAVMPVYVPKYLTYTTPWLAVLLVLGARGKGWPRKLLVASTLVALALQLPLRQLVEAPDNDYRTVSRAVAASDADAYLTPVNWLAGVPMAEPSGFVGMRNLAQGASAAQNASLYPQILTPTQSLAGFSGRLALLTPGTARSQEELAPWYIALEGRDCQRLSVSPGRTVGTELWECP